MPMFQYGTLFRDAYGTAEMRAIFEEDSYIEAFLSVEAALARAEAKADLIPDDAAEEITEKASIEYVDKDVLEASMAETNHISIPILEGWNEHLGEAGQYVHWGATTQDIIDMTMVTLFREAYDAVTRDLDLIKDELLDLASEHRETPMIGRTHFVHAVPITFGLKVAVWIDEIQRHLDRLEELEDRLFVGQFYGATGTLASLEPAGLEVQQYLEEELGLPFPPVTWTPARDRFVEIANTLAEIAGTLSKIAEQILFMNRPEVREVDGAVGGGITSSAMPHKQTPKLAARVVSLAPLVRAHSGVMEEAMETDDERSMGRWYAEFVALPEAFLFTGRALENVISVLEDLDVDAERMKQNLDIHGELVTSERVMMALAEHIGRPEAHDIVREDAIRTYDDGVEFSQALEADERVTASLSPEDIERLTDPTKYTGQATAFVDRVLDRHA